MADEEADGAHPPAPWLFLVLHLPYGLPSGFVTVTLAYLLAQAHVPTAAIAGLVALQLAPQTWKVVWSPVVDCTWRYRGWYAASAAVTAAGLGAEGFVPLSPAGLPLLSLLVLLTSLASTGVGMSTAGLIAHVVPPSLKGRTSGWVQAGNIGGAGIGGGLGLWLTQHAGGLPVASLALAAVCLACTAPLLRVPEPEHAHRAPDLLKTLRNLGGDLWAMVRSRLGLLALVLVVLPIGTGAAANLFAAIATDWRTSADIVALVTGLLGGAVSAVGCVAAGYATDRIDRKAAYLGFGLSMAACAAAMALAPRTPATFVAFTLVYALTNGFMYAAFYAVSLEAVGRGAAATKMQLLNCLCNLPILLCTLVVGAVQTRAGSGAMLWADAGLTLAGVAVFGLFVLVLSRLAPSRGAAPPLAPA